MNCPNCHTPMRQGRFSFETSTAGRGSPSTSTDRLAFRCGEGRPTFPQVGTQAFHCETCDTVVIPGCLADAVRCFDCGAVIPSDVESCPKCGWNWK